MPQSLANVLLHVIFSTKNRDPYLSNADVRKEMHGCLAGTMRKLECSALIVGGIADHVHILCQLSRTVSVAELLKEVKGESSKWIKTRGGSLSKFRWQNGYSVFSVSQSNAARVRQYIARQEEHHRARGFQEELRALLQRHHVEFDERYVWD